MAHRKRHIHRVTADDFGQRATVRAHDVALCQLGTTDFAGDRGSDRGVAEVDVGGLQVGIRDDLRALRARLSCRALVEQGPGRGIRLHQLLRASELCGRIGNVTLCLQQRALRLLHCRLEGFRLDPVQDVTLLDDLTLLEQDSLEEPGDTGSNLHPLNGLYPPYEFSRPGDRPQFGCDRADRYGRWLLCRPLRRCGDQEEQGCRTDIRAHSVPQSVLWSVHCLDRQVIAGCRRIGRPARWMAARRSSGDRH